MPTIQLFDGTTTSKFGKALVKSFAEIAKYQRILVKPKPGSVDYQGFSIVKQAVSIAYDYNRSQVRYSTLLETILNNPNVNAKGKLTITLTEFDLYDKGLNWCFGTSCSDGYGGKHIVASTSRIPDIDTLAFVVTHELGHALGAASPGRSNTEKDLGSHCTNTCIMEQKLTVPAMRIQAKLLSNKYNKFCHQCADEIKAYQGPL